ncbi:MAG TPA: CRTAC1 family protein [Vicinamibacterales bacterium]|nr:CRTAC1 family protein [Vicinamibacterales bacterium]
MRAPSISSGHGRGWANRIRRGSALGLSAVVAGAALHVVGAQTGAAVVPGRGAADATVRLVPDDLEETGWLRRLRNAQLKAAAGTTVFHDFQFTDSVGGSGISFRHRIVDDAGRTYKAAHYDHGNGVAIADVDGDGRSDLYFVNQVGGNHLARNLGGGRFEDVTASAGVAVPGKVSVSASFADIDNDGDPDLYVTTVRGGNHLFENDGEGRFRDITRAAGLDYTGHSSSAVFFDYDRDGLLDLLLVNVGRYTTDVTAGEGYKYFVAFEDAFAGHLKPERTERSILYRNQGKNRFVDVSVRTGLRDASWTGDASVVDVNEDGWPDVYLVNMQGDDQYYQNERGARFVRKGREVFPRTSWGSMGIKVFDANHDGRLDIYVTDMHSDMSEMVGPDYDKQKSDMKWPVEFRGTGKTSIWGNSLFLKVGSGRYREASDELNLENYCPWGPSVGDLNADGFDDVFIASGMNYPERYMINSVRLNEGGRRFVDAEFLLGIEPRQGGVVTPFFELDASGRDKGHRDAAGTRGKVVVWGARGTRSSVIFDLDGDGDLDIVTNEFNAAPMVLVSNLSERTQLRYLAVKLAGTASNRDGLGAVVKVTAGGTTYTKVFDGNSGYLSHSIYPLYFGLGSAEAIERVEVIWPSGRTQVVDTPVEINSLAEIRERE